MQVHLETAMNNPVAQEKLSYSIAEAVHATSLSRSRIYQLMRGGALRSSRVGRRTLIDGASLRALITQGSD